MDRELRLITEPQARENIYYAIAKDQDDIKYILRWNKEDLEAGEFQDFSVEGI